jgi:uridine kinase
MHDSPSDPGRAADLEILKRTKILKRLDDVDLGWLLDALDQAVVTEGTLVVHEGDESDGMFFVLDGEAVILRGSLELGRLQPGDYFGELGLLGLRPRAASVRATGALRLGRLGRSGWQRMSSDHPRLALDLLQHVIGTLGDQLVRATDSVGLLLGQRSLPRRMNVSVHLDGKTLTVSPGTHVGALLPETVADARVVAAHLDQRPVSLDAPIVSDASIEPLTTASWDGRDVVRRSAGLAFLEVAHTLFPERVFRLGGSIGSLQCVEAADLGDAPDTARALGHALAVLIERNVPFREEWWATEEAEAHLTEQGWYDGARWLHLCREATVGLVSCGELYAIRTGPFVRRSGELSGVSVVEQGGRLFLRFTQDVESKVEHLLSRPFLETEALAPRYGSEMTMASKRWLAALGVTDIGSLDDRCVAGEVSRIIRPAESFHEKRIGAMADAITARREQLRVICVAGPSSSGKTTFLRRLSVQLEVNGVQPVGLSLDDYYVDREATPKDERGEHDFEALEALQLERLQSDVAALLRGETITLPRYDFSTGISHPKGGPALSVGRDAVLVLEGIHALNPALLGSAVPTGAQFRVFVHPATILPLDRLSVLSPLDVRLLRRIVRDRHGRSFDAAATIARWPSVRRGEQLHIYPYLPNADVVFDTFLPYEVCVLKIYAERYLMEVPRSHASYGTAWRLRHLIDRFVAIHPDHVPPTSLLREFIGGSGFEY